MYWIVIIVALIVQILFAIKFSECAKEKGHSESSYFLLCLFFGVAGWCLVAALPDYTLHYHLSSLIDSKNPSSHTSPKVSYASSSAHSSHPSASVSVAGWQCTCGRTNADYVSTCTCGVHKRDLK